MPRFVCLLFFILTCLPSVFAAPPERPVVVGFYDFPPSIYTDANGEPKGPMVEVVRKVFERAGYPWEPRSLPSARIYAGLVDGSVQVWAGAPKPQLDGKVLVGRSRLSEVELNLYHRPGTPAPRIPEDLEGRALVVINGYTYFPGINRYLDDPTLRIEKRATRTHTSALEMLMRQRGDYLLDYAIAIDAAAAELGVEAPPHVQLQRIPMYFVVTRQQPEAAAMLERLDAAYEALLRDGVDLGTPGRPAYLRGFAREVGSATSGSSGQ